jgi:hypothetical protein
VAPAGAKPAPEGRLAGVGQIFANLGAFAVVLGAVAAATVAIVTVLPGHNGPPSDRDAVFTSLNVSPNTSLSAYSERVSVAVALTGPPRAGRLLPVAYRSAVLVDADTTTTSTTPTAGTTTEGQPPDGATGDGTASSSGDDGDTPTATTTTPTTVSTTDETQSTMSNVVTDTQPASTTGPGTGGAETSTTDTDTSTTDTDTSTKDSQTPPVANGGAGPGVGYGPSPSEVAATTTAAAHSGVIVGSSGGAGPVREVVALPPACTSGHVARCGLTPEIRRGASPAKVAHLLAALFTDSRGTSCDGEFHPEGALVDFDLRLVGFYGQPVTVRWSLWPDGGSHALHREWLDSVPAYRFTPAASDASFAEPIWVPEPLVSGRYFVALVVTDRHGVERASANSKSFDLPPVKPDQSRC